MKILMAEDLDSVRERMRAQMHELGQTELCFVAQDAAPRAGQARH